MKVTPALKKEMTNWLDTYWTTYLKGDIQTWATFIRDDYRNIGGTKEEIWNSKQEIIDYTNSILSQMLGTVDIRNRKVELIPYGEYMMVHEFTDLFVKIEGEWTFYGPFRMSSLLEKTDTGWIALHQHGSYPDMKAMEGEAFSIDALKAENAKLQAAVKSRTLELEQNNRELEIEAAVERVRVQSMAMQHPQDLEKVNKELLHQLTKLEIPGLAGVSFYFVDPGEIVTVWDLSSPGNMNDPNSYSFRFDAKINPLLGEFVGILKSTQQDYFILDFPKDKLLQAVEELKDIDLKIFNNFNHAIESGALQHQWNPAARITDGILSIDLMMPPSADTKTIVLKMAGAFNQAYQRFLDLQKAAAQAKEAEIELALERVRARTMAMQKSEELAEASVLLFEQLKLLGVNTYSSGFSIWENEDLISWMCNADGSINPPFSMPLRGDAWHRLQHESWKNGEAFIWKDLQGEEMQSHFRYLRSFPLLDEAFKKSIAAGHPMPERQVHHVANFSQGNLLFITLQPCPEAHEIFIRFAKVFEQTYTRFLDLQKAEAQAKEAQIQLALERVRARSMAMHKSEELADLSLELVKQVQALGVATWFCAFNIYDEDSNNSFEWGSNGKGTFPQYRTPREGIFLKYYEVGQSGETLLVNDISEKECAAHYDYLCSLPGVGDQLLQMKAAGIPFPTSQIDHVAFFKYGYLIFITYEPVPEAHDIFIRFAKVFEQTYTRFLDLQKAEQQAREGQIEASLERVRSRSLAMHHTSELQEVIHTVHKELLNLNIAIHGGSFIAINRDIQSTLSCWGSGGTADTSKEVHLPLYEEPFCTNLINRIKGSPGSFTEAYTQQEKKDFFTFLFKYEPWSKLDAKQKQATLSSPGGYTRSCCVSTHTSIFIINHFGEKFSAADNDILHRFGKVFEQAYTRFLDLQKAEAQAREAKIEAALERTRTQSMIMQHSKELDDTLRVFHEQVLLLGIPSAFSFLWLPDEKNDRHIFWAAWGQKTNGLTLFKSKAINYPLDRNEPATAQCLVDWKSNEPVYSYHVPPAAVENYFAVWQELIDGVDHLAPGHFSGGLHYVEAFMKYGCFGVMVVNDLTEDEKKLLSRFANEFERTYTRFLDLQKAEAQAREAQIEVSLERVRSRAMAMQTSEELNALIGTVFTELTKLDLVLTRCLIMIFNEETNDSRWWMANSEDPENPMDFYIKQHDHPPMVAFFKAWRDKKLKWTYVLEGQVKNDWDDFIFSETELCLLPAFVQAGMRAPDKVNLNVSFNNFGCITLASIEPLPDEHFNIMLRFAKVFDLTYTRFNDLKQAEAQVKEAKIETELERVRSRSMGMQTSEELKDVIKIVYQQLRHLDIHLDHAGFVVDYTPGGDWHFWIADEQDIPSKISHPYFESVWATQFNEAKENGKEFFATHLNFDEKNQFYNELLSYVPGLPEVSRNFYLSCPGLAASTVLLENVALYIENFSGTPYIEEENNVLMRFGKVFQQTYTRFLDLQKAEAQAREAKIESALEKVRSRTMAMQHSKELSETSALLFQQIQTLGVPPWSCGFNIWEQGDAVFTSYMGKPEGVVLDGIKIPLTEEATFIHFQESRDRGDKLFIDVLEGETLEEHYRYFFTVPGVKEALEKRAREGEQRPTLQINHLANFSYGNLMFITYEPCPDFHDIFIRFAKVFEQTYTRFLDLQKAEAQARESKIEAALEKARARTMGMQSSDELPEVANVLFLEVQGLGIPAWSCGYNILAEDKTSATCCMSSEGTLQTPFKLRLFGEASFAEMGDFFRSEQTMLVQELGSKSLEEHYAYMKSFPDLKPTFDQIDELGLSLPTYQINHLCKFTQGFLLFITYEKVPDSHDIFKRFTKVFEQTYTRFLDLKKAEAQAREAQIELALERVRARAMSMQHSVHLKDVIEVIGQQLHEMGLFFDFVNFIVGDTTDGLDTWNVSFGQANPIQFFIPRIDNRLFNEMMQARKDGLEFIAYTLTDKETFHFVTHLITNSILKYLPEEAIQKRLQSKGMSVSTAVLNEVFLTMANYSAIPYTEEENSILKRFGNAFQQAFTRFLDLQKAEAQTREAQINLAVERVRARALAMFQSEEILQVVNKLKEEIMSLDIPNVIAATIHLKENDGRCRIWDISSIEINDEALHHPMDIRFKLEDTDPNFFMRRIWGNTANYFVEMQDENDLRCTIQWLRDIGRNQQADETVQFIESANLKKLYHPTIRLNNGRMGIDLLDEPAPEIESILEKMGAAFDLAYTRFLDLQKAETQSRQAKIETALEKVRARALAMQEPEELVEVAEVLRHEMGLLGVEELETCSIFIHDETINRTECWYALKDIRSEERKLVCDHFPLQLHDTWVGREMEQFYNADVKQASVLMQGARRKEWINYCEEKSFPLQGYYGEKIPDRTYHLYKFSHGAIGAASAGDISAESWDLLQRAASVFSLAYSRFKDLTQARFDLRRLKEEKQKAETALSVLQTTQKQLIQAEKMASLGELTAGIAHEIQNPLNFVNNFSELSNELLDEMMEEVAKGNFEGVRELAGDVKQNLEKINHHGKRADGIVKGMLQHSRTSAGQAEPTDINLLAGEYLRLAYHGLRAKDNSFNAMLKTDFDSTLANIHIIPQDIGRVILNLVTNAFYAVAEKKKAGSPGYEPAVTVTTRRSLPLREGREQVELSVKDNGQGIPQNNIDKIFQPFFTTKPTGQGTGLGLSLAYDIIKAHGGELTVKTREGEGCEFMIQLPLG